MIGLKSDLQRWIFRPASSRFVEDIGRETSCRSKLRWLFAVAVAIAVDAFHRMLRFLSHHLVLVVCSLWYISWISVPVG